MTWNRVRPLVAAMLVAMAVRVLIDVSLWRMVVAAALVGIAVGIIEEIHDDASRRR